MGAKIYPRYLHDSLVAALQRSPVVLLHGPRQSGKTTLARTIGGQRGYRYVSFDQEPVLRAAKDDPLGFIQNLPDRTILDEVQRAPEIFTSIKYVVDQQRTPGRFILTGSANVLLVPKLTDSLAGRMAILRLHPLAQSEMTGGPSDFLDTLFDGHFRTGLADQLGKELVERVVAGGYPAAVELASESDRTRWYREHIDAQIQRDVQDLSRISSFEALPRLMAVAASHTAQMVNFEELASPFDLTRNTIRTYVTLLERVFLLDRLPAWHKNQMTRLVKRPKLHIGDTGVAAALLAMGTDDLREERSMLGHLLESFVYQEIRRQASWHDKVMDFYHFRDRDGLEVDIVIERGISNVAGVEVKAAATVNDHDFRGLRKLAGAAGRRFKAGIVLYDGPATIPFGDRLFAVPIRFLWESPR